MMILAIMAVLGFAVVTLFCCLVVASRYDDMMERSRDNDSH